MDNLTSVNPDAETAATTEPKKITRASKGKTAKVTELIPTDTLGSTPIVTKAPKVLKPVKRSIEEVSILPVGKLTDAEKNMLIDFLKSENATMHTRNINLDNSCKSAFEKVRLLQDAHDVLQKRINKTLNFIEQSVDTCHKTVTMLVKGE